jgi:hypothetical protein
MLPLAVSANAVALVASIAAVAAVIAGPLTAWIIAKQTRDHERTMARDTRLFDVRQGVYLDLLLYLAGRLNDDREILQIMDHDASWRERSEPSEVREDVREVRYELEQIREKDVVEMANKLDLFGSPELAEKFASFSEASAAFSRRAVEWTRQASSDWATADGIRRELEEQLLELHGHVHEITSQAHDELTKT